MKTYTQTRISDHFKLKVDTSKISDWANSLKARTAVISTENEVNAPVNSTTNKPLPEINATATVPAGVSSSPIAVANNPTATDTSNNPPPVAAPQKSVAAETSKTETTVASASNQLAIDCQKNIRILDAQTIDYKDGVVYLIYELVNAGFNFFANTGRGTLYNMPKADDCHYLMFGKYKAFLLDFGKVRIVKTY